MTQAQANPIDLTLGDLARLEEVVDREALSDVCRSFFELFGLSIRVLSKDGALLADVHQEREICQYVNGLSGGATACARTVAEVKTAKPDGGPVLVGCFTGGRYRVEPIRYQGRQVGRFVIGPYLPAETRAVPRSLLEIDPGVVDDDALEALAEMPRVRPETAERLATHFRKVVDLLLFSSHRAHLTSEMHVASVREGYRELAEKTAKLQQAYNRLKELDKLKSNFLATVSHELRTPLTSIIGYSEMLEAGIAGDLGGEQREFVETIRRKGDHLLALITSLLDLSKLEQGALRLEREPLVPKDLLDEIATTFLPRAIQKTILIEVEAAENLPAIDGDPVRLRQVLSNLVDNAMKFTPDGGTILLRAVETDLVGGEDGEMGMVLMAAARPAICVEVKDSGAGMKAEELPRIFDAFYQVDGSSTREHGGAGLGLSIVKRLVNAHEGEVRVSSEVGVGTTFSVTLPAVESDL